MGPKALYLGNQVPDEELIWQDPVPAGASLSAADVSALKEMIMTSGVPAADLIGAAWASASTYRGSDKRGGSNGGRLRLAPQKDWEANNPAALGKVLAALEAVQSEFAKPVSMADLIVLGGCAAVEAAATAAGTPVEVAFTPGRGDALAEMTDVDSFAPLEPKVDGFRNLR